MIVYFRFPAKVTDD